MLPEERNEIDNRRQSSRNRFLKQVKIIFNGKQCVYDAYLRNVSAYGAQLETRLCEFMPNMFDVFFVEDAFAVPCEVVWRRQDALGVKFKHGSA